MQDLNDLYYFAMVVDHAGFAAAERALGIPKSRLSRRISQLETDLGVRLLQRSTRRFAVTDVGTSVYRHAQSMLAEAQAAREVVDRLSAEPRGVIRVSVPVGMAQQHMPKLLPEFLAKYPQVRVQLQVSNRRVDIINEGIDVALRVRAKLDDDGSLVMRSFGQIQELLVASPDYLKRMGRPSDPDELAEHVTLSISEDDARQRWELHGPDGEVRRVELKPRVIGLRLPDADAAGPAGRGHHPAAGDRSAPKPCAAATWKWCCPNGACRRASSTPCSPRAAACCRRCGCSSTSSPRRPRPWSRRRACNAPRSRASPARRTRKASAERRLGRNPARGRARMPAASHTPERWPSGLRQRS